MNRAAVADRGDGGAVRIPDRRAERVAEAEPTLWKPFGKSHAWGSVTSRYMLG